MSNCIEEVSYTELLKWLKEAPHWQSVATFLLPEDTAARDIEMIDEENVKPRKIMKCQMALSKMYVESSSVEVSWQRVYEAFFNADYANVAKRIREKYHLK